MSESFDEHAWRRARTIKFLGLWSVIVAAVLMTLIVADSVVEGKCPRSPVNGTIHTNAVSVVSHWHSVQYAPFCYEISIFWVGAPMALFVYVLGAFAIHTMVSRAYATFWKASQYIFWAVAVLHACWLIDGAVDLWNVNNCPDPAVCDLDAYCEMRTRAEYLFHTVRLPPQTCFDLIAESIRETNLIVFCVMLLYASIALRITLGRAATAMDAEISEESDAKA